MSERCVLELSLKTEKWQEDIVDKRLEVQRQVYNAMLGAELKKYKLLQTNKEYKENTEKIYEYARNGKKTDVAYKDAAKRTNELLREYGFSEFSFKKESMKYGAYYTGSVSSKVCDMSVASPMWRAFEDMLFRKGDTVHFKKKGTVNSVVTDGKSFLRVVDEDGKTVLSRTNEKKLFISYGLRGHKILSIPIKLNLKNEYELEMLSKPFKQVRIVRRKEKGKNKYYVQLCLEGKPAVKFDKETGEIKHPVGNGKIGIYVTTKFVTVATDDRIVTYQLSEGVPDYSEKLAELNQFMDRSRRATNPDNFNEDGTIKKGIIVEGQRKPLKWNYSKSYNRAKGEYAELKRLERVKRELHHRKLTNEILSFGDELHINDYSFAFAARRSDGEEFDENGKQKSKKRAGKNIGENAPAMLISMLEKNVIAAGGSIKKYNLSEETDYETTRYAGEKWAAFLKQIT